MNISLFTAVQDLYGNCDIPCSIILNQAGRSVSLSLVVTLANINQEQGSQSDVDAIDVNLVNSHAFLQYVILIKLPYALHRHGQKMSDIP